jgi:hypothetical protein
MIETSRSVLRGIFPTSPFSLGQAHHWCREVLLENTPNFHRRDPTPLLDMLDIFWAMPEMAKNSQTRILDETEGKEKPT